MEKELRSHNKRITSQEKVNKEQDESLISLEERTRRNRQEPKEKVSSISTTPKKVDQYQNAMKEKLQDGLRRTKRSQRLEQPNASNLSPYPDNPDMFYRKGILCTIFHCII